MLKTTRSSPAKMTAASQPLVGTMTIGQPLRGTIATVKSMDLELVEMVWSMLRSQKKCLSLKNCLSQENCLNQEN